MDRQYLPLFSLLEESLSYLGLKADIDKKAFTSPIVPPEQQLIVLYDWVDPTLVAMLLSEGSGLSRFVALPVGIDYEQPHLFISQEGSLGIDAFLSYDTERNQIRLNKLDQPVEVSYLLSPYASQNPDLRLVQNNVLNPSSLVELMMDKRNYQNIMGFSRSLKTPLIHKQILPSPQVDADLPVNPISYVCKPAIGGRSQGVSFLEEKIPFDKKDLHADVILQEYVRSVKENVAGNNVYWIVRALGTVSDKPVQLGELALYTSSQSPIGLDSCEGVELLEMFSEGKYVPIIKAAVEELGHSIYFYLESCGLKSYGYFGADIIISDQGVYVIDINPNPSGPETIVRIGGLQANRIGGLLNSLPHQKRAKNHFDSARSITIGSRELSWTAQYQFLLGNGAAARSLLDEALASAPDNTHAIALDSYLKGGP
jgi:hypothetical protein